MKKETTTDNVELTKHARKLLGSKFKGVYASDEIPALSAKQPYAILNTKPRDHGGEHWTAVARVPRSGKLMHYDSYGRSHKTLFPLPSSTIDTEDDLEQHIAETNCGQRSIAWLLLFDSLGPAAARLV